MTFAKICKMESPNLGKYMNLHLEIITVPMHFLTMDTIEISNADSAYKYAFTLTDMLTNYVFVIPVKDICGKRLVHGYIYKVYLPFGRMEKFLSGNGTSFINKHWKNLAKAPAFTHIQSSLRNPQVNSHIELVHTHYISTNLFTVPKIKFYIHMHSHSNIEIKKFSGPHTKIVISFF